MQNKRVFGMLTAAGCALFVASAMGAATDVLSQDFESISGSISDQTGWYGYGTVTASNYTAAVASVGTPIDDAAKTKVLVVEGRVTCSNATTTAQKPATVDMMVQVALPDDGLAFPSGTTTEDIQIAVGVDTNAAPDKGELKVYCKNKSNEVGWYSLGTNLVKDTWHRVSFTFDYANGLCQIRLDGEPMMTANGYLTTDTLNLSEQNGSWYKLAFLSSESSLKKLVSVQVIGSTAIDELLVKHDTAENATVYDVLPVLADATSGDNQTIAIDGVAVPKTWIEQQGITRSTTEAPDGSGMSVGEKYAAGYGVADGKKFELKDMTLSGNNAILKFNEATIPAGYKYVVEAADNSDFIGSTTYDVEGTTDGTQSIPLSGNVKYYRIRLTTAE